MVSSLIDQNTKTWNKQLIHHIFMEEEATTICKISLSLFGATKKVTWWPTRNDLFYIKSAYSLEVKRWRKDLGETSNPKSEEVF